MSADRIQPEDILPPDVPKRAPSPWPQRAPSKPPAPPAAPECLHVYANGGLIDGAVHIYCGACNATYRLSYTKVPGNPFADMQRAARKGQEEEEGVEPCFDFDTEEVLGDVFSREEDVSDDEIEAVAQAVLDRPFDWAEEPEPQARFGLSRSEMRQAFIESVLDLAEEDASEHIEQAREELEDLERSRDRGRRLADAIRRLQSRQTAQRQ